MVYYDSYFKIATEKRQALMHKIIPCPIQFIQEDKTPSSVTLQLRPKE